MDTSKYVLNEVGKGLQMGLDSISNVTEKVEDGKLKEDLLYQYDVYNDLLQRVNTEITKYSDTPEQLNPMQKAMGWMSVEVNTLTDRSNSKISEMMLKGTNMGIIEGRRLLNHNKDIEPDVRNILNDFVVMQEDSVETLKKYL